jgi:hypothetical protein
MALAIILLVTGKGREFKLNADILLELQMRAESRRRKRRRK